MSKRGLFIAIEGGDGSGKRTQSKLLGKKAREAGYDVLELSFPQYGEPSALFAGRYLDGQYGKSDEVHPELASLAYAVDRFAAGLTIREHLQHDKALVIADRYVASNLAHQGTKIANDAKRQLFYDEIMQLEYETLGIPKPSLNLVLLVPSDVAQRNVDQKDTRSYTDKKRDIHEADANHLELAKANYEELCRLYPEEFTAVECMNDELTMHSIEDIHEDIWQRIERLLS
jgi:dTMP kinase